MGLQFNSPRRKCIRWDNVSILHNGSLNIVKDGYTDKKYVYWDISYPTEFKTSDVLPLERTELVFINNDGIGSKYASRNIIIDNIFTFDDKKIISEHISNNQIHTTQQEKDIISKDLKDSQLKIGELYEKNVQLDKQIYDLNQTIVDLDRRIVALETASKN